MLRLFISYAREDETIAIAVSNAVQMALGPSAEVFIDSGLRFGLDFKAEIKKKLDETDVLIAVSSDALKPAFGFTGLELGYFIHSMERDLKPAFRRRVVPIYLEKPPDVLAEDEGVNIGISRTTLALTPEEYDVSLKIDWDNAMVKFLREFQALADKLREDAGEAKIPLSPEQRDLLALVKRMQMAIFCHLKNTPESTLKPQKQITIRTSDAALEEAEGDLPPDAEIIPVGSGNPMSIFGLSNEQMTWYEFQRQTKKAKFRDSWADAISSVVCSSLQSQLDVDNSQVILSYDEKRAFRVILTAGTRYFNGVREFNVFFVEYLKRGDYGDRSTTTIFKGLEMMCRFRSLFFEKNSEFSSMSFQIVNISSFRSLARSMERELNLLRRDALESGLDRANVWAEFVDWTRLAKMAELWRPLETRIRKVLAEIRSQDDEELESYRPKLLEPLREMEQSLKTINAEAIAEMSEKLRKYTVSSE
ncbi:MAG TPA: toll/interleukin-1 receptor domain-containing protein [Bryobacteraceae bacterium]|nr:toll/interleukin-1 receptor domain-containing protein [Bryobacteraceae bacterium]